MSGTLRHAPTLPPEISESSPLGAVAVCVIELWQLAGQDGLLVLAGNERRAEALGALSYALAPHSDPLVLPAADVLPYDGIQPSRTISGRRSSVLRRLAGSPRRPLVLATADAALQRVPGPADWDGATTTLRVGGEVDSDQLRALLEKSGYELDSRVDEPGEYAIQGQAIDIFPAGGLTPIRAAHADGVVTGLSRYDPATQRTSGEIAELMLDPMDEFLVAGGPLRVASNKSGLEKLGASIFDYLPRSLVLIESAAVSRAAAWLELVREAFESRREVPALRASENTAALPPDALYLRQNEWEAHIAKRSTIHLPGGSGSPDISVPKFCAEPSPVRALRQFLEKQSDRHNRLIFAAGEDSDLSRLEQRARRAGVKSVERADTWKEAVNLSGKEAAAGLIAGFHAGFVLPSRRIAVITAADVLGSRTVMEGPFAGEAAVPDGIESLHFGDLAIHLERGAAILRGLETVSNGGGAAAEMVRMTFAGADLLLPVEELGLVWKYGCSRSVPLDRADGASWEKRRTAVEGELAETARKLIQLRQQRAEARAPKLVPPAAEYERFVARFRYSPTPDQARAAADVLSDLASGRPMDRLVSGDVGFGKTEVAMRAAAAAILGGAQVAIAVPTTVLARQHYETFSSRFAGLGIKIGRLSRLVAATEQRVVKKGLSDGSIRLVIGTHAIAAKDVRFKELGLVIVDEEQRFGTRDKAKLSGLTNNTHLLTLTATPIPRTLQLAAAGLKEVSVLANPPARRLPVRTAIAGYDPDTVQAALRHERRRAGQSFVVCPRIEDIEPWQARLQELVPELERIAIHGKMPPGQIDDAMMRFARGEADILLSTNIIESGLDLPRANTILVWRPDRFGLAQLHQLRGRVGRSARRGYAYFLTDSSPKEMSVAAKRLRTLGEVTELGAGFRISRQDLDIRGAGDLFGENQTGHQKLVGPALYRHLLERALRQANGEIVPEDYVPELRLELAAAIPADYIRDEAVRLELYDRLAKASDSDAIHRLADEIEDRFGPPPGEMIGLLALAELRELCRRVGIARVEAGPRAIAITYRGGRPSGNGAVSGLPGRWSDDRLICDLPSEPDDRIGMVTALVRGLAGAAEQ
jgi:transcription-repair coupling factor (superfamily II helicase)